MIFPEYTLGKRLIERLRWLQADGFHYQKLVDETACALAQHMLIESDREIRSIAMSLGYANDRSFIRAFRRWSGTTPARWRAQQKLLQEKTPHIRS